jgi:hypothetical protein
MIDLWEGASLGLEQVVKFKLLRLTLCKRLIADKIEHFCVRLNVRDLLVSTDGYLDLVDSEHIVHDGVSTDKDVLVDRDWRHEHKLQRWVRISRLEEVELDSCIIHFC